MNHNHGRIQQMNHNHMVEPNKSTTTMVEPNSMAEFTATMGDHRFA